MNAQAPIAKRSKAGAGLPQAKTSGRVSAKLRHAIDLIAIQGLTGREAARRAGLHEVSLYKALAKPHVAAALEERKAQVILECDKLKGIARAIAIQTGLDLMQNSQSDNVRARMVEFFAGDPRGPMVAVQVNTAPAQGYSYRKPDITSGAVDVQAVEIKGDVGGVVTDD